MISRVVRMMIAAVVLLAAVSPRFSQSADPYDIYVLVSLTGPFAFVGQTETAVLHVLENQVNHQGGIRGQAVRFVIQDDQSNASLALQLANSLKAKNIPIILGPDSTALCNAITPVVDHGPVLYCYSPGIHPSDGSYSFSSSVSTAEFIKVNIRYMRLRGWTKIGVMTTTDATGQDGDHGVDDAVALPENAGKVTIVDREHFNPNDVTVAAQVSRLKAAGAQAVIVYTVGTPFATFLRSAYETGFEVPVFTTAANFNYEQLATYTSFEPRELYMALAAYAAPDSLRGPLKQVVGTYLAGLKAAGIRPAQTQIAAWDPSVIAVNALRALGTDASAEQVRSYIANLNNWVGIEGVYDFRKIPQRGVGGDWLYISRWDPQKQQMIPVSKAGGAL